MTPELLVAVPVLAFMSAGPVGLAQAVASDAAASNATPRIIARRVLIRSTGNLGRD
jgi:hypothetical protein